MKLAATGTAASTDRRASDGPAWLNLAASPTFALMASLTALDTPDLGMCSATSAWLPVNDMALMYLLMSLFHLTPWLRLLSRRSAASHRPN